jgi:hypothetical protein
MEGGGWPRHLRATDGHPRGRGWSSVSPLWMGTWNADRNLPQVQPGDVVTKSPAGHHEGAITPPVYGPE